MEAVKKDAKPEASKPNGRKPRVTLSRQERMAKADATKARACLQAVGESIESGQPVPSDVMLALGNFTTVASAWVMANL